MYRSSKHGVFGTKHDAATSQLYNATARIRAVGRYLGRNLGHNKPQGSSRTFSEGEDGDTVM